MTRPADCSIIFALPTSRTGFEWSRSQTRSEYANGFLLGWDQYEDVCDDLNAALGTYRSLGVTSIALDARRETWARAFRNGEVVLLFAHWLEYGAGGGAIEFWDGPFSVEDLVNQIPEDFRGVIDLSVCHPFGLA